MLTEHPYIKPSRPRWLARTTTLAVALLTGGSVLAAQSESLDEEFLATKGATPAGAVGGGPIPLTSILEGVTAEFYGYIQADASYDTNAVSNGNFAQWVMPEDPDNKDDGQFNITARQTRLGAKFAGPEENGIKSSARVEVDFYGGGGESSSMMRMRHAYVNLDWIDDDFSVLAGQTSDVVSPLVMPTLNYTVAWWSGDIGTRHNQIRATKGFDVGDDSKLLVQVAATRVIGAEDIGRPGFQARVAYSFPGVADKQTTVGVSAVQATEAGHTNSNASAIDLSIPVAESTSIKAEFFTGENVDNYAGNIGVNSVAKGSEIGTTGYWAAVSHTLNAKTSVNVGFGSEDNDDKDLTAGQRMTNSTLFANVNQKVNSNTTVGFEVAQHTTDYKSGSEADDLRFQLALTFKF